MSNALPTCSFLILTYNQERFIPAAVKAALAQDGPPIEILISDDASSDRTFDIARQLVGQYDGPHHITLNRNPSNIGLVAHINQCVDRAKGQVLIPAYGDDISRPNRALKIAQAFAEHDPSLVHSQAEPIDHDGKICPTDYPKATFFRSTDKLDAAKSLSLYLGASGGWSRRLFEVFGPIKHPKAYDDLVLGFRAALLGRIHLIDEVLLSYREGVGISNEHRDAVTRAEFRRKRHALLYHQLANMSDRLEDAKTFGLKEGDDVFDAVCAVTTKLHQRMKFYDESLLKAFVQTPRATASEILRNWKKK